MKNVILIFTELIYKKQNNNYGNLGEKELF